MRSFESRIGSPVRHYTRFVGECDRLSAVAISSAGRPGPLNREAVMDARRTETSRTQGQQPAAEFTEGTEEGICINRSFLCALSALGGKRCCHDLLRIEEARR